MFVNTVKTVICDPSKDLNEKVAYNRGSLNTALHKYWCDLQLVFYYLKISNFLWSQNAAYYTPIGVLYPDRIRVYAPIGTFLQPAYNSLQLFCQ